LANDRRLLSDPDIGGVAVTELLARYWRFAKEYYGEGSGSMDRIVAAMRILKTGYGRKPATQFGPLILQTIQRQLVGEGHSRRYINHVAQAIRRIFKWGVSQEIVPVEVHQALLSVPGLRLGRTTAREPDPIVPVSEADVEATLPFMLPIVADMVQVQRLCGCRPGEVVVMQPGNIDRTGNVWEFRPVSHKGAWRGKDRIIFLGPRCQTILTKYLLRPADTFVFSPAEAEKNRRAELTATRRVPLKYGNRVGTNRKGKPARVPGDRYTTNTYRQAIHRACDKAGVERWAPNRLRHAAGTEIRRLFGLEASQVVLGHASADVTQIYAERDAELARRVAREVG
jgi:integrase